MFRMCKDNKNKYLLSLKALLQAHFCLIRLDKSMNGCNYCHSEACDNCDYCNNRKRKYKLLK